MFRKIFYNAFAAFFLFPLLLNFKYWIDFGINPIKKYATFQEAVIQEFFNDSLYFILAFAFLILILLPYQLIKDSNLNKGRKMSIGKKVLLFTGLICGLIILFGSFNNIWWRPWYKNLYYIVFALSFGLFFAIFLHLSIDRYEERKLTNK